MKKFSNLISLLFVIISFVSAGGSDQKSTVPQGRTEVVFMEWGEDWEQGTTKKLFEKYNSSQTKNWISYINVPYNNYLTKLNTMASSGSLPDAALMLEEQVLRWAENNMLLNITDIFDKADEEVLESSRFIYKGNTIAYSVGSETMILYYNKDIFDKAGIPYPPSRAGDAWTWAQFVDAAKKLTLDRNGKTPNDAGFDRNNVAVYGVVFNYSPWFWPVMGISNGGGWLSEDGKKILINTPETIEAAQAIADLYLKDRCAVNPATGIGDPAMAMLSGQVAMAIDGQWSIGASYRSAMQEGLNYSVGVLPRFKKAVSCNTGAPVVIFTTSSHPQETKEVVKLLYDPQNILENITSGSWQPTRKSWYTNEEHIKTWADNPHRPPLADYRNAVVNYTLNNVVQNPFFYFSKWAEYSALISAAMDPVWQGKKTAKEALDEVYPKLKGLVD